MSFFEFIHMISIELFESFKKHLTFSFNPSPQLSNPNFSRGGTRPNSSPAPAVNGIGKNLIHLCLCLCLHLHFHRRPRLQAAVQFTLPGNSMSKQSRLCSQVRLWIVGKFSLLIANIIYGKFWRLILAFLGGTSGRCLEPYVVLEVS